SLRVLLSQTSAGQLAASGATLSPPTTSNPGVVAVNKPNLILKLAVVTSSILLVGAFIAHQAGYLTAPKEHLRDAASSAVLKIPTSDKAKPEKTAADRAPAIMPGSKSFVPRDLGVPMKPATAPQEKPPTITAVSNPSTPNPSALTNGP